MPVGTIDIKLRPIKIAFLVSPLDRASLLKAIQINSCLWGGVFNPIIPVYKRTPKIWGDGISRNTSAKDIIDGYISGFDPDYVVPVGDVNIDNLKIPKERIISSDEIVSGIEDDGTRLSKYSIKF